MPLKGIQCVPYLFQSYRRNAFEASTFVPKVLPKSLLRLFVDIEFTGHAMEFEQKFSKLFFSFSDLIIESLIRNFNA